MNESKYGTVTIGYGTPDEKEVSVESYVEISGDGGRKCTVVKIGDQSGYLLNIENPPSSGRSDQQMFLTYESLSLLLVAAMLHLSGEGISVDEAMQIPFEITSTDNLKNGIREVVHWDESP